MATVAQSSESLERSSCGICNQVTPSETPCKYFSIKLAASWREVQPFRSASLEPTWPKNLQIGHFEERLIQKSRAGLSSRANRRAHLLSNLAASQRKMQPNWFANRNAVPICFPTWLHLSVRCSQSGLLSKTPCKSAF